MGCCDNKHQIQESEELLREKIHKLKLSCITYKELKKQFEHYSMSGKLPKKTIKTNIFSKENTLFHEMDSFEQNFLDFLLETQENQLTVIEASYTSYIFLKHNFDDIHECNRHIYEVFTERSINKKLTLQNLERNLIDYFHLSTYKLNEFFIKNLDSNEKLLKEELMITQRKLFNSSNINEVSSKMIFRIKLMYPQIKEQEKLEFKVFDKCFEETNLSNFIDVRDLFFATFIES